jgi:hypothetical protein
MSVEQVLEQAKELSSNELEVLIVELRKEMRRHNAEVSNRWEGQTIVMESPIELLEPSPSMREILEAHRKNT